MARELFIDASAWIALANAKDNDHAAATQIYASVLRSYNYFVTTNLIVAEVYVILRKQLGHNGAAQFLETTQESPRVILIMSTTELELAAQEILRQYQDHDFSYVDAVSFALIRQRGISDVFTFDHHFRVMGFFLVE